MRLDLFPSYPISLPSFLLSPPLEESLNSPYLHVPLDEAMVARVQSDNNFSSFSSFYLDFSSPYFLNFSFSFNLLSPHPQKQRMPYLPEYPYLIPFAYVVFSRFSGDVHDTLLRALRCYLLNSIRFPRTYFHFIFFLLKKYVTFF